MTLREYLQQTRTTHATFAARIGVTRSAVTQWINGITLPSASHMVAIHQISQGKVTISDWGSGSQPLNK